MRYFLELIGIIGMIIGGVVAFIFGIFLLVASASKVECANLKEVTKRQTDFRWFGGCYVEHEGEMLPYERWKLLDIRIKERK